MSGLVLRLAGPLQSWGEHSMFADRDTQRHPTRSALIGMFAAAQGLPRGEPLDRYAPLQLTVRIDRPGTYLTDFHTAGGGLPRDRTVPTADGHRRPAGTATIVTRRAYLSGAVFTVAAEGPKTLIAEITTALRCPHWQPYLGRRCCPPDQPLLLRADATDPVGELRQRAPLPNLHIPPGQDHVDVDMITELPAAQPGTMTELNDTPITFSRHDRRYSLRAVSRTVEQLPAALGRWGSAHHYQRALMDYAREAS